MRLIDADGLKEKSWDADTRVGYVQVVDVGDIDDAPTVDATPIVHARIEEVIVANGAGIELVCSACRQMAFPGNDYCPHCGAKFDLE